MWDERFAKDGYLFGTEPAAFLLEQRHHLHPGSTALAIADGEGRNSVFMAELGVAVTAMDGSEVGVAKARELAQQRGVDVEFNVGDILTWDWSATSYDLVVGIFFQFLTPDQRPAVFDGIKQALRPGGTLLLHGYTPKQVTYGTGGPPIAENMYTEELLRDAFGDLEIERLEAYETELTEGSGHVGISAVIDLVATKPQS